MFQYVLFDLDGTLTDPGIGITNGVMYALKKYGISVEDRSELYKFIGPPLKNSFMEWYGFSEEQAMEAISFYREHFGEIGIFENEVYEGIPQLLATLKKEGRKVLLATSKPELYAKRILEHFDLLRYFDLAAGAAMDEKARSTKADVIRYALEGIGITPEERILMVGDREHDVEGAKQVGLPCLGVLYGYGDREELEHAGAVEIAETVGDVHPAILRLESRIFG